MSHGDFLTDTQEGMQSTPLFMGHSWDLSMGFWVQNGNLGVFSDHEQNGCLPGISGRNPCLPGEMAEGLGFEPRGNLHLRRFSRPFH